LRDLYDPCGELVLLLADLKFAHHQATRKVFSTSRTILIVRNLNSPRKDKKTLFLSHCCGKCGKNKPHSNYFIITRLGEFWSEKPLSYLLFVGKHAHKLNQGNNALRVSLSCRWPRGGERIILYAPLIVVGLCALYGRTCVLSFLKFMMRVMCSC
jgi:hypothetical protein